MGNLINDARVRKTLEQVAHAAPNGYDTLATLEDTLIVDLVTWPDTIKVVWPNKFMVLLPGVDEKGYIVYDSFKQLDHLCAIDPANPGLDLTNPVTRNMTFGLNLEDMNFMWKQQHGDVFYIGYGSGNIIRRTLMFLVLDPLVA